MDSFKRKIKQAWEEHPLETIAAVGFAATAAAKLVNAMVSARNSQTWKMEVERRQMMSQNS